MASLGTWRISSSSFYLGFPQILQFLFSFLLILLRTLRIELRLDDLINSSFNLQLPISINVRKKSDDATNNSDYHTCSDNHFPRADVRLGRIAAWGGGYKYRRHGCG